MNTSNKTTIPLLVTATFALSIVASAFGQVARQPNERMWEPISERSVNQAAKRVIVPVAYRTVRLDKVALSRVLASAPMEFSRHVSQNPIIELPMPDGTLARFRFEESPVMEPEFAAQYPDWKTYRAQGIDDPAATSRFDWLPSGFHAIILAPSGTVLIDPYAEGNRTDYITYWRKDAATATHPFVCGVEDSVSAGRSDRGGIAPAVTSGPTLRTYRLALACTNEFAVAIGSNNVALTIQAEVLIMNRVNGIYEREVTIHMNMVNNAAITYAGDNNSCGGPCNAGNDPYTNDNRFTMLGENTTTLNNVIGSSNYDIGHVFFSGGGGVAYLASVCGAGKAGGVSGLYNPAESDGFAVGVVSHEMGHQFGANHTFNGTSGSCNGNRNHSSAYEPGSGVTIEGYGGGTCGNQSMLPTTGTDTFHVRSIEEIIAYTQNGAGNCAALTSTGNVAPAVNLLTPANLTIPRDTPFSLTAYALDINNDSVTFDWEEYDLDAGGVGTNAVPNTDADGTPRPILRLYSPSTSGTRTFPSLQYILNNANVPPATIVSGGFAYLTGELLPHITRTMMFQVVVRDNHAGAGGINTVTAAVNIDGNATPFAVTYPNTAVQVPRNTKISVTWNASGAATNVKISLSTDGGNTFPTVLAANTTNNGFKTVLLPNVMTSTARIKVEALDNIYFDISDTNFSIQ